MLLAPMRRSLPPLCPHAESRVSDLRWRFLPPLKWLHGALITPHEVTCQRLILARNDSGASAAKRSVSHCVAGPWDESTRRTSENG